MLFILARAIKTTRYRLTNLLLGPLGFAVVPCLSLIGFLVSGERSLIVLAFVFPFLMAAVAAFRIYAQVGAAGTPERSQKNYAAFQATIERALRYGQQNQRKCACFVIEPDDFDAVIDRYGADIAEDIMARINERIENVMRNRDFVVRLGDTQFGVSLAPAGHLNIENALGLADRIQAASEEPISIAGSTVFVSISIGFCLDTYFRVPTGHDMVKATFLALQTALRNGPSAIRAYSPDMQDMKNAVETVPSEIERALDNGEIHAWFQPQVSTDTGKVTGFEALARWQHPKRGLIPPGEFLSRLQKHGRMERLGDVILDNALSALKKWDAAGIDVPHVSVNLSPEELQNPNLVRKVEWALDRADLRPHRLALEILETVVSTSPDDVVVRNISGLSDLGCMMDLDDFGTGHASFSSIRRFAIERIKIDRSFVSNIDQNPEQHRIVSAILLMAEQLDLDTLAEGVETAGEHTMLAQLGCGHVQGFGIGKPMPFNETEAWVKDHLSRLQNPPPIGRNTL